MQQLSVQHDPDYLAMVCTVDPFLWATLNGIQLVAGTFRVRGHEYQAGIMRDESPRIVVRKGTQVGITEVFVLRSLHRLITGMYRLGILYLFPTRDDVTDFSTSRFNPLIKDNPELIGSWVQDTNRANLKRVNHGYLYFRSGRLGQEVEGEKTSSKLKSIPVDQCIFDEWDEMDPGAQPLALGRMQHSEHKHEVYLANPTIPNYGIDALWQRSDQHVWHIRCEGCGKYIAPDLTFPDCLQRRKDGQAYLACTKCGKALNPAKGEWVQQRESDRYRGYWVSHLIASTVNLTDLLDTWESGDFDVANFYRLKLGIPYLGAKEGLQPSDLYRLCSHHPMRLSAKGPSAMGIDIGKRLHVVIIDKPGDGKFRLLWCGAIETFEEAHDIGRKFGVRAAVVDKYPETREARRWGQEADWPTWLCEYRESTHGFSHWDEHNYEVYVNRTEICDETHNLVKEVGRFELPRLNERLEEYIEHMCNLVKAEKTDKQTKVVKYVYMRTGDDHFRHATNYAWLAATKIGTSEEGISYGKLPSCFRHTRKNWMTL